MLSRVKLGALLGVMLLSLNFVGVSAADINVSYAGKVIDFADAKPVMINNRVMVAVRPVMEAAGASVFWIADTNSALIRGKKMIVVKESTNVLIADGRPIVMDTMVTRIGGRLMMPLRYVAEAYDLVVKWDTQTNTAIITDK